MESELKRLEKNILLDFYEKNDNPHIEVLADYDRVWARHLNRKTFLWEGEAIDDGFVDMKTSINFELETQIFEFNGENIPFNMIHHFLEKDFQRLIDRNKDFGIYVKITIGDFRFFQHDSYYNNKMGRYINLLTTYKMERL